MPGANGGNDNIQGILNAPKRSVTIQNDTIQSYKDGFAYYSSRSNTITQNIVLGDEGDEAFIKSARVHEQKHADNAEKGSDRYWMSLEQYYKVCMYDEISANVAELLAIREQYVQAKTDNERAKIVNSSIVNEKFSFYFSAVQQGKIDPFTKDPEKFMEEMKFIAQETQKMWMTEDFDWYAQKQLPEHIRWYASFYGEKGKDFYGPSDKRYNDAKHIMFGSNLGGIDFTPFIKEYDVVPQEVKQADQMIKEGCSAEELNQFLAQNFKDRRDDLSSKQQKAMKNSELIRGYLNNLMKFRSTWVKQFYDNPERAEVQKIAQQLRNGEIKCVGDDKITQKYIDAVIAGKLNPNPLGMDTKEREFIGSLIQDYVKEKGLSGKIDEHNVTTESRNSGEYSNSEVSETDSERNFDWLVRRNLTVGGNDFSSYMDFDVDIGISSQVQEDTEQKEQKTGIWDFLRNPFPNMSYVGESLDYPRFEEWSPEKRVSEPYNAEIIDLSSDFLLQRYKLLQNVKDYTMVRENMNTQPLDNLRVANPQREILQNEIRMQKTVAEGQERLLLNNSTIPANTPAQDLSATTVTSNSRGNDLLSTEPMGFDYQSRNEGRFSIGTPGQQNKTNFQNNWNRHMKKR